MTNHEKLMQKLAGMVDLPEDVVAAILDDLQDIAAVNGSSLDGVHHTGYQDFAGREYPGA